MSVRLTRFKPDSRAIAKLLVTERMEGDLGRRGLAMADAVEAAGIQVETGKRRKAIPVTVTIATSAQRARVRVILDHPAGQAVEAKYGVLAASLDAARDPA